MISAAGALVCEGAGLAHRQIAAQHAAPFVHVSDLRTGIRRTIETRRRAPRSSGSGISKRERKYAICFSFSFLLLVRGIARLAGFAHAVAFDGLGQHHGGTALVLDGGFIGVINLVGIVPAAMQVADLLVGQVGYERRGFRIPAEELLAHIGAALGLEGLVFAVHALVHQLDQLARRVFGEKRIPVAAPEAFDHVPAGAAEDGLQLLNDLAVAAHRTVEPLQVAVDHEDQIVELFAHRHADGARRFRLVHLAVAQERPDFAGEFL